MAKHIAKITSKTRGLERYAKRGGRQLKTGRRVAGQEA